MATTIKLLFLIALHATALNLIVCYAANPLSSKKLLFVFGDSLFDPGNNQYLNNSMPSASISWPYGMNMNNKSTGRLSDGLLVPDFVALFANLPVDPPCMQPGADLTSGANFASAGAGVLGESNGVMNLNTQLTNFKKVVTLLVQKKGEQEAKKILMSSVYLFSMGGNDYFRYNLNYRNSTKSERVTYMHTVVASLTNGFKEIYAMGGRKFAIQNVAPLGCLPSTKAMYPELNGACVKNFLTHPKLHNKALYNKLNKMAKQLPGFKHSIMNYYYALGDRISKSPIYGFKEGKVACCGSELCNGQNCGVGSYKLCKNPSEYVFFDGGHTTQKTSRQLAELLWSGGPNVTGPYNVKQLFEFP
ncbi:GDSL esterase/lipase 1-like [Pistacia vera]|uniref:GDSL esterase/lipase 1-like n=1 Tax=Pistacia vera TaxID=55513 RepID=UPI0012635977|nr:GDSL esterase/lipase 1-like [Pistacia vera]